MLNESTCAKVSGGWVNLHWEPRAPTELTIGRVLVNAASSCVSCMEAGEVETVSLLIRHVIRSAGYYNSFARIDEIDKYTPAALRLYQQRAPENVLVARRAGGVVGFCVSHRDASALVLEWCGVSADWRGCGFGRLLIEALIQQARKQTVEKIVCLCPTNHVIYWNLLYSAGFQAVKVTQNDAYGQEFLVLEKGLVERTDVVVNGPARSA